MFHNQSSIYGNAHIPSLMSLPTTFSSTFPPSTFPFSTNYRTHNGSNTIQRPLSHDPPLFVLLTDSHGKYFPPVVTTPQYKLIIKSISGLQWVNTYNTQLCTRSLILSSSMSALLSTCNNIFFLIGTNSIRNTFATQVIEQVNDIVDLLRSQHPHLMNKTDINMVSTFPCLKPSLFFPSGSSLFSNLNYYNNLLKQLASSKNFTVIDLPITEDHLGPDGMHIHLDHLSFLFNTIQAYLGTLVRPRTNSTQSHHCSPERVTIMCRHQRRHDKPKHRQMALTVIRPIARVWKLKDLKTYLQHKRIKFIRLPEIHHHQLHIQFNNVGHQQYAERNLPFTAFDQQSYYDWISTAH